jgi:hypothetical protein
MESGQEWFTLLVNDNIFWRDVTMNEMMSLQVRHYCSKAENHF